MKRFALSTIALALLWIGPTAAWGPDGHVITARVAELNLNDKARAAIKDILTDRSFTDVRLCTWADEIKRSAVYRKKYPDNDRYHYVDIPVEKSTYDPAGQCKDDACVIAKIETFRRVLADPKAEAVDRKEALLFLVHLVGDLHQPLHCANRDNDRGGNLFPVRYKGEAVDKLNLHRVWDEHLVKEVLDGLEPLDRAGRFNMAITADERKAWAADGPKEWALQSHEQAKAVVYKDVPAKADPPFDIDDAYVKRARPVVVEQLKRGGVRLAKLLNETLGREP